MLLKKDHKEFIKSDKLISKTSKTLKLKDIMFLLKILIGIL